MNNKLVQFCFLFGSDGSKGDFVWVWLIDSACWETCSQLFIKYETNDGAIILILLWQHMLVAVIRQGRVAAYWQAAVPWIFFPLMEEKRERGSEISGTEQIPTHTLKPVKSQLSLRGLSTGNKWHHRARMSDIITTPCDLFGTLSGFLCSGLFTKIYRTWPASCRMQSCKGAQFM